MRDEPLVGSSVERQNVTYTIKINEVVEGGIPENLIMVKCEMNANGDGAAEQIMNDLLISVSNITTSLLTDSTPISTRHSGSMAYNYFIVTACLVFGLLAPVEFGWAFALMGTIEYLKLKEKI